MRLSAEMGVPVEPASMPNVDDPTPEEKERHELNQHNPPNKLCEHCQMGRGRDKRHEMLDAGTDGLSVVGLDLCCLKAGVDGGLGGSAPGVELPEESCVLVMVDAQTGAMRSVPKPDRKCDAYTVAATVAFIKSLFHRRLILRPDSEGVLLQLATEVEQILPERVVVKPSPTFSS